MNPGARRTSSDVLASHKAKAKLSTKKATPEDLEKTFCAALLDRFKDLGELAIPRWTVKQKDMVRSSFIKNWGKAGEDAVEEVHDFFHFVANSWPQLRTVTFTWR